MDKIEISVDRVEENENINVCTCPICQNIFYKPVMCTNCENHFCTGCIDLWILKHPGKCPMCQNYEKKKASIILNNILDKLKIQCIYKEKGCKETLAYDSLIKHENNCAFSGKVETKFDKMKKQNSNINNSDRKLYDILKTTNTDKNKLLNSSFQDNKFSKRFKDDEEYTSNDALNHTISEYMGKENKKNKTSFQSQNSQHEQQKSTFHNKNSMIAGLTKVSTEISCKVVFLGETGKWFTKLI